MYTLLMIEDEPLIRRGIRKLVNWETFAITDVFEATNGEEGWALFQQHQPDFILLDINMPKMNGLELAEKIKAIRPQTKIAIITGYDYYDYAVKALKIGVEDYVLKPISKNDVAQVVTRLVEKRKQEQKTEVLLQSVPIEREKEHADKEKMYEFIHAHIHEHDVSLTRLAAHIGFSVGYCSGLFKKLFGVSFQEYVVTERLERSKLLLLSTQMKMYEIAAQVGFEDPNYFSTSFKKKYGVSPQQYRERQIGL